MKGFSEVTGVFVIIFERGIYKQVPCFDDGNILYAKAKGGFIRLMDGYRTSCATVTWKIIDGVKFKSYNSRGINGIQEINKK